MLDAAAELHGFACFINLQHDCINAGKKDLEKWNPENMDVILKLNTKLQERDLQPYTNEMIPFSAPYFWIKLSHLIMNPFLKVVLQTL